MTAYSSPSTSVLSKSEHSVYVWKDMSLRELVTLLRSVSPGLRVPGNAKFSVRRVYAAAPSARERDDRPTWDYKDLGFVFARDLSGKADDSGRTGRNDPSLRTLEQHRFIPGDFLDIAYLTMSNTNPRNANGPISATDRTIPSLQGNNRPSFPTSTRRFGMSEADQAWGVAGDQHRRSGVGMRSGGNRINPLLSGRGGMSIMGAGRRQSQAGEGDAHGRSKRSRDEGNDSDMQTED